MVKPKIEDLIEKVFSDVIKEIREIKAEHPEEWAEYEKRCKEYWATAQPIIEKDPDFISRRYYGKRKGKEVDNGKTTENERN